MSKRAQEMTIGFPGLSGTPEGWRSSIVVVSRRDLLWLDHGTQKYRVDSFWFVISLRLVKSNDHERALHLFVFRNPCRIVEVKPCSEKHTQPVRGLLEPFVRIGRRVMTVVVEIWTVKHIFS